ncbi:MAG TPA: sulfatase-like hydrolase/transferase [Pyrinomonadaceae bacterium]|jgi:hypothetical protein|nr:sulfatase-like hydrolase/transferase [Pyrinomonadaceae bacterium]
MLKRALIAISLANLCFIPAWRDVLDPGFDFFCYHTRTCPIGSQLTAITLNTLLLALVFFIAALVVQRLQHPVLRRVAQLVFLLIILIPLNSVRVQFDILQGPALIARLGKVGFILLALGLLLAAAFIIWRLGLARLAKAAASVVLIMSPFVLVAYSQATWVLIKSRAGTAETVNKEALSAPAPAARRDPPTRVLWLVLDELDYRVAFLKRPATLKLPEFDRIRSQSLFASNAYPPAWETLQSIPALVTGRMVDSAKEAGPNELAVQFHGSAEKVNWGTQPNVFSRAREAGNTTAVIGWYHPYCRIFGRELTACSWDPLSDVEESVTDKLSIRHNMLYQIKKSFLFLVYRFLSAETIERIAPNPDEKRLQYDVKSYLSILNDTRSAAVNPDLNLVFAHLPIPHPPGLYNRERAELTSEGGRSYLDNLALTDRTLGELRRAMESAGLWDSTTVLISSDHWWRAREIWNPATGEARWKRFWTKEDEMMWDGKGDRRIPFILKLAGQKEGVAYDPAFNTVLSQELLLAILRGEVARPETVTDWIDKHRTAVPTP